MQRLIEALRLLASSPDEQQAALPPFVVVPDELALLFNDEIGACRQQVAGQPAAVRDGLAALEKLFDDLDAQPSAWTIEAVNTSPVWAEVRRRAGDILSQLGVPVQPPDLSWVTYVRGE